MYDIKEFYLYDKKHNIPIFYHILVASTILRIVPYTQLICRERMAEAQTG